MATQDVLMAPGAYDADTEQIRRRLAYAQALQGQQAPQGQMVAGRYVAPSWTQHAAKLLGSYLGRKEQDSAMQDFQNLSDNRRAEGAADMQKIAALLRGTPAQTFQPLVPNDDEGNPLQPATSEAKGPDLLGAMMAAKGSRDPSLQNIAPALLTAIMPKQAKWEKAELPNRDGTKRVGYVDINSADPISTFREGGTSPVETKYVNGQGVNPFTNVRVGDPIPRQEGRLAVKPGETVLNADGSPLFSLPNYNQPFNSDGTANLPYQDFKLKERKAGKTDVNNTVSVAAPENKYNQVIGEGLAKDDLGAISIAKDAPEVIRNAQMVRRALESGAITGTAAPTRQAIQKALETVGLLGPGKAATTEALISGLSKITLAGVKTSGLGAGNGFTDKDLRFLEEAVSGRIDSTPGNIRRVADLSERVARANHAKGLSTLSSWQSNPVLSGVARNTKIESAPEVDNPLTADESAELARLRAKFNKGK